MTTKTKVVWAPHPGSQYLFLNCPYDELLYHGTRGPGKTDALLMDFAQDVGRGYGSAWQGILFRQTYPQLKEVIKKSRRWFPQIFPAAQYNKSEHEWTWPTGETLAFRHMDKPDDYWNYHGHEYPWLGWEELTNWPTGDCYDSMFACNRSSLPGVPKRARSTCNPWGSGHGWVKKLFIDAAPQLQPITRQFTHPLTGEEITSTRGHIFGHLFENKTLLKTDPEYLLNLKRQRDPNKRKAWLKGSWDIAVGGYFSDVWDADKHVIRRPWTPPKTWPCYLSFDWGSAKPFSVGFWTEADGNEAPDGRFYSRGTLIRFDEWYGCQPGEENIGIRLSNVDLGASLLERVQAYEARGLRFKKGPADPSIFKQDGGPSIATQIAEGARGREFFDRADNTRVTGWQKVAEMLEGDEDRGPRMLIMANCTHWRRTVPILPRDERNWDDIDTDTEDHIADDTRYMAMWKPKESRTVQLTGF